MNILQLERIRNHFKYVKTLLEEDSEGTAEISIAFDLLEFEVDKELKELLWVKYLEAEGE